MRIVIKKYAKNAINYSTNNIYLCLNFNIIKIDFK